MGRAKQLLPYQGSTLAAAVTRTLLEAGASGVVVITRTQLIKQLRLPDDARAHTAVNDNTDSEMIDSIRIGLARLDGLGAEGDDGVVVVPADMPELRKESCRVCIAVYTADPRRIVVATHRKQRGHPIIFPFALREEVNNLEGGLRMLPRLYPERVCLVDVDDPGVRSDVDTVGDYERLSTQGGPHP
jgi:CTP:molybdopterin cytidylyltransferase MocA